MKPPAQLDLFARKRPRNPDAATLIAALKRAAARPAPSIAGLTARKVRLLMRPLPRITVPR